MRAVRKRVRAERGAPEEKDVRISDQHERERSAVQSKGEKGNALREQNAIEKEVGHSCCTNAQKAKHARRTDEEEQNEREERYELRREGFLAPSQVTPDQLERDGNEKRQIEEQQNERADLRAKHCKSEAV